MTSGNGAAIVCGVAAVEVDTDDLRDAGLLHGDAVDDIGLGHGAFTVSDYDELRGCLMSWMSLWRPTLVSSSGRRLRRGYDAKDQQREGSEGLLSAGEQKDVLQLLARRRG